MRGRPQRLAGEFIGTFGVVLFTVSAICADQFLRNQNQPALGPLGIALAYGLVYGALVTAVGYSCGRGCGHLNPAVTLGFWGARKLGTFDALSFCAAQLAGAAAAAYSLRAVLPEEVWRATELGTPMLANGITRTPGMLIEGFPTFFLVFAVFSTSLDGLDPSGHQRGTTRWLTGLVGGLIVATGALFTLPFTGGSMNPARAFGPALAVHYWTNHGVYWIGPLSGGVVAAWIYDSVFLRWHAHPESGDRPADRAGDRAGEGSSARARTD
jgi:glycerol uptake facilitator protein